MTHTPIPLKTIGLLGGMSTEATREYYQLINRGVGEAKGEHNSAEILIYSVNFQNIERFVHQGLWHEAGLYLAEKARQVQTGGADFLLIGSNTMHRVREVIREAITIPLVDIFEVTARAIRARGLETVGLLGTYPVMTEAFYKDAYEDLGVRVIVPPENQKREIDRYIWEEMCHHIFTPEAKNDYLDAVRGLCEKGAEGVILGCTEIKILIRQEDLPETPVFDTTTLHCDEAVRLCVG